MRLNLSIISNCDDCGACCIAMESPPGYAMCFPPVGEPLLGGVAESEDYAIVRRIPARLRAELRRYYQRLRDESGFEPGRRDQPCIWFDEQTGRCRNYAYRPTTCREFQIGSEGCRACRAWRDDWNIDVERIKGTA